MASNQPNSHDHGSHDQGSHNQGSRASGSHAMGSDRASVDEASTDGLSLGAHERKAHPPGDNAAPQQVAEAQDFMARNAGVHGFGIGQGADGGPCMMLFADDLPTDQVPETLDGLPVRLERSGESTAGG